LPSVFCVLSSVFSLPYSVFCICILSSPYRLVLVLALTAGTLPARRLPIQVFATAQGLPRNTVECLAPGPNGLLWVCTSEGLARFDGYRFRVFGTESGLPSRVINEFLPSRYGGYWVITNRGVCRIAPGSKIGDPCRLLAVDKLEGDYSSGGVLESQSGETWIATTRAIYRLTDAGSRLQRTAFEIPSGMTIMNLADGLHSDLLVATNFGVFEWRPGQATRNLTASIGNVGPRQLLRVPRPGSPDEIWFAAGRIYRIIQTASGETVQSHAAPHSLQLYNIMRRRDGTIWATAHEGLVRLTLHDTGEVEVAELYSAADGLPDADLTGLTEDSQGDLWASTEGSGILRIGGSGLVSYSKADGLLNNRIGSIFEDPLGRVAVQSSYDGGVSFAVKNGDRFERIPIRVPPSLVYAGWGWNQVIAPAHNGEWWFALGPVLLRFPKINRVEDLSRTAPVVYDKNSPLACDDVFRVFEDRAGDVWISCLAPKRGLTRWERKTNQFHHFSAADGLPDDFAFAAFRDGSPGTLWIGASQALIRVRQGRFELFRLPVENLYSRDLLIDHAGRLWLASRDSGIFRCDNPNDPVPVFLHYTVREGLSSDVMSALAEDTEGFIYAGSARGVDRIDPRAPVGARRIRFMNSADGLPDSEQNTAFRDHRGHLWFGSLGGVTEFDPSRSARLLPPEIYFMRVRVRGEDVPLPWEGARSLSLDLAADRNQVEVEYAAVDLRSAESLRYQYRLHGVDRDWREPVKQLNVNYASLPSGPFHFEVRAVDADGQLSPSPARFDAFIQAPLWRRPWFLASLALLVAAATIVVYNYRVRHLLAVERLRTRIAADLHDDIGASLTQISILSELARRDSAPQTLTDIANIARGMVAEMSDIVWAINPRHDRFVDLAHRMRRFASDVLGGADIDLKFDSDKLPAGVDVPLEARRQLYLIFKEAVNNVARHSGAAHATITLELDQGILRITVQDDGRGFDPNGSYSGEGLSSIARRLQNLGGTPSWESQRDQGTRFTAVLPLPARTTLHELVGSLRRTRR